MIIRKLNLDYEELIMYKDLAHAVEELKNNGIENLFIKDDDQYLKNLLSKVSHMQIVNCYEFDMGTDPGDESSLYIVETPEKEKKYVVISYGAHVNPNKAKFIDALLKKQEQAKPETS